jgi:CBS domain-containing protein
MSTASTDRRFAQNSGWSLGVSPDSAHDVVGEAHGVKISELMHRDVISVSPETTLKDVAALLVRHRISGVPVCGPDGRVLGVVSEADILLKEQGVPLELGGFLGRLLDDAYGDSVRFDATTAGQAMTAPAVTVAPDQPVAEAARLMTARHVNRLPVVTGSTLVGILTRADLVRAFDRDDAAIADEIADDVLLRTLWIEPGSMDVRVDSGVVTLEGGVETRTIAEIVESYVRRVPGVVAVHSELTWAVDDTERRRRTLAAPMGRRL